MLRIDLDDPDFEAVLVSRMGADVASAFVHFLLSLGIIPLSKLSLKVSHSPGFG